MPSQSKALVKGQAKHAIQVEPSRVPGKRNPVWLELSYELLNIRAKQLKSLILWTTKCKLALWGSLNMVAETGELQCHSIVTPAKDQPRSAR